MRRGSQAGLAALGAFAVTVFTCAPAALATPGVRPSAKPSAHKPSQKPSSPPAPPPPPCEKPHSFPASHIQGVPWAQSRLGFTNVWKITKGKGVTVAVVDSGINASHPQLAGRVIKSINLTGTPHNTDCYGHGTAVAGIIAAQDERNSSHPVPFVGVAPDVKLISVKIQEGENSTDTGGLLAKGIERAVEAGADIINVSAFNTDYPALRKAVRDAQKHDVLIVASAGNVDPQKKKTEQAAYPASYPGVLSVGAVDENGSLSGFSNTASKVDVTAPGSDIVSTTGDGYVGGLQGTSFSAPYVTGVAALIKASHPKLTYQQIMNRIIRTADGGSAGSGAGMVNPYAAVTALDIDNGRPAAPVNVQPIDIGGPPPVDHRTRNMGALIAAGTTGAALLVLFGGVVAPLGARRRWRPGRVEPPPGDDGET
jgi:type VII secretion-associated serine protease mycosin